MSKPQDMHVVPQDENWALTSPQRKTPLSVHSTQEEAIAAGRKAVHAGGGGELLVHGRDGQVRDKVTIAPGNDPYPPKG